MSFLGEDKGLWPGPEVAPRYAPKTPGAPRAPKAQAEPVVLKPYVPRAPIQYVEATREELIEGKGGTLVYDTECFSNLFVVAFKNVATKKVTILRAPFDDAAVKKLRWIMANYTVVSFNGIKYDLPLINFACMDRTLEDVKALSDALIAGMKLNEAVAQYGLNMGAIPAPKHIDLIEVAPSHGGLKLYGGRLHAKRIQDVPWSANKTLEDWQVPITVDYCINDLEVTELMFNNLQEQLALRAELSKEYKQNLMSKSDAQIAETVITSELQRLTGKLARRSAIKAGASHKFVPPVNMSFKTEYMQNVLRVVTSAEFTIDDGGYIVCPKEFNDLEVKIGTSTYRMGIGGLHSSETTLALQADDEHLLIDRDVASYYPAIAINCGLSPKAIGDDFLKVYKSLVDRRLEAKRAKNISVSESLKISINGTFGKTGSPYSVLYAPEMLLQITIGGQLYLLMLIERLEAAGIHVASANTDGCLLRCPVGAQEAMNAVIAQWEKVTGFVTEETRYRAFYARDVNAYMAVKYDGTVKGKNVFYDPWRDSTGARDSYWRFQKNPTCQICVEAVERLIVDGTPLVETIKRCTDITRFVAIKNVTGGAHWRGEYLGKIVRWYYAKGIVGTINYITNNRIVADTEGAKPLMDLPDAMPEDVDYDYYVRRAEGLLKDMGFTTGG